ncbi:MAG: glucuronate isomerase [Clostridia bacterium]|nr:glucuronate isomerase [Clostridia bacterium]
MKPFMDKDFLLTTETAKALYHGHAASMPIVDYHCHVSPKEIYEDRRFENITQVWLGGDHYKWRIMRSNGVDEHYITGGASDREKFQKFAEALPKAIGNPMYHWCHLELQRYFGYYGILNGETAEEVWNLTKEKLAEDSMGVRGLIAQSNVAFIGTTDDPIDSLEWHEKLAEDPAMKTTVAPSFRPDKALNIDKAGWREYIETLSSVSGIAIDGIDPLKEALGKRIEYFDAHGCRASDHGLDYVVCRPADRETVDGIVKKGLAGQSVSMEETEILKTDLLIFCAQEYYRLGWVMQLHYNCLRNPNSAMFRRLGPDTGFDVIGPSNCTENLAKLLDALNEKNALPRTILYSLDAGDNEMLDTVLGAFQGPDVPGKIQHGSAWWFNDNKQGMIDQMTSLANLSLLGNFVGMLTDSRSFLSYTRHEYFRRILCQLIGQWVENGEYPNDEKTLSEIVEGICYNNAKRYFNLK